MPSLTRCCKVCQIFQPLKTHFYATSQNKSKYYTTCKKCHNLPATARAKEDPRIRLLGSSRSNAWYKGLEHTLKIEDIPLPEFCRYLGVKLDYRCASEREQARLPYAPSIDRIDPTKGYIPGNIQIISDLANRMKQDATVEQLLAFAEGVLAAHG